MITRKRVSLVLIVMWLLVTAGDCNLRVTGSNERCEAAREFNFPTVEKGHTRISPDGRGICQAECCNGFAVDQCLWIDMYVNGKPLMAEQPEQ